MHITILLITISIFFIVSSGLIVYWFSSFRRSPFITTPQQPLVHSSTHPPTSSFFFLPKLLTHTPTLVSSHPQLEHWMDACLAFIRSFIITGRRPLIWSMWIPPPSIWSTGTIFIFNLRFGSFYLNLVSFPFLFPANFQKGVAAFQISRWPQSSAQKSHGLIAKYVKSVEFPKLPKNSTQKTPICQVAWFL